MDDDELVKLIGGPYRPPRVRVGDVETCLYRDCDVVITSWTDARISWPRCRARDQLGGSGLLINEMLLKAIQTESAEAIKYWFCVGTHAVWSWRKAFGIPQRGTPGSQRLYDATTEKIGEVLRGKRLPAKAVREHRERAIKLNLARHLREYADTHRRQWTADEAALLGAMKDTQLARQLGQTRDEVHKERVRRGIPAFRKPPPPESLLSAEQREQLRRQRIAAAKKGKKRPRHVIEAMPRGRKGKPHSAETRAKIAAGHRARRV